MKSIKWTTVSFLAAAALGAGAFAFAGCTVTSGEPSDPGGTVKDGGSGTDSSTNDGGGTDGGTATCEGNTKQAKKLVSDACQNCLNANCCSELKGCFNKDVSSSGGDGGADGGVQSGDCNEYADCVAFCYSNQGGSKACLDECNAGAPAVVNEYDALITCGETKGCKTPCGL
jgi:hypothetical protein